MHRILKYAKIKPYLSAQKTQDRRGTHITVLKGLIYMKIQESAENYLETILMLGHRNPYVRSIDIANELSFSKPSVSVAMKNLRENGYIEINSEGHISLTGPGREIAETMYERHAMLSQWLIYLGVDEQTAVEDACRIEHVVSAKSFKAIKAHITEGHELPDMEDPEHV